MTLFRVVTRAQCLSRSNAPLIRRLARHMKRLWFERYFHKGGSPSHTNVWADQKRPQSKNRVVGGRPIRRGARSQKLRPRRAIRSADNFCNAFFPDWLASSQERNRSVDSSNGRILSPEIISHEYRFGAGLRCFTSTRRSLATDDSYIRNDPFNAT